MSLLNLYWNIFSEFICQTNVECNGKGTCTDQKCQCRPGWDSQEDCMSKCIESNISLWALELHI